MSNSRVFCSGGEQELYTMARPERKCQARGNEAHSLSSFKESAWPRRATANSVGRHRWCTRPEAASGGGEDGKVGAGSPTCGAQSMYLYGEDGAELSAPTWSEREHASQ